MRGVLATAVAAMLSAPLLAGSGVVDVERTPPPESDAVDLVGKLPRAAAPSGWVLRCWQDGRLIVDEPVAGAPVDLGAGSARLQALDRNGQPLYLAETRNATCIVRLRAPERPRGLH